MIGKWHGFFLASDYSRLNCFLFHRIKLGYTADIQRLSLSCSKMLTMSSFVRCYTTKYTFSTRTYLRAQN